MISPSQLHPRFWVGIWSDPKLAADAEALAHDIAGEGAPDHILALARDVAAARIDMRRVNQVQNDLLRSCRSSPRFGTPVFGDLVVAAKSIQVKSPTRSIILAVYRYERSVHSRWWKAQRALDAALRRGYSRLCRRH
jgi:hypothetical protein